MRSEPPAQNAVRFGAFELDLRAHQLRKNGRKLKPREQQESFDDAEDRLAGLEL